MKAQSPVIIALAFFAIYIVWGTTYLAAIFGLQGFPPFILSALRFFVAGVLLFAWCKAKGDKIPSIAIIKVCVISGCVMLIGGSGLVVWAEKYVSSGHAATITATEPFLFILLDKKRWAFYFKNKLIIAGLVIGFSGLLIFMQCAVKEPKAIDDSSMFIMANVVLFISALLWVTGSLYAKSRLTNGSANFMANSIQLIAAGIVSAFIATLDGEWKHFSAAGISMAAWGGLLYLIIFGSLIAYLAFAWLISIRPPALVSTHTYVNPVVAVLLGWLLINEHLNIWQVVALFIILAGMLLTNLPTYKAADKNSTAI